MRRSWEPVGSCRRNSCSHRRQGAGWRESLQELCLLSSGRRRGVRMGDWAERGERRGERGESHPRPSDITNGGDLKQAFQNTRAW